jgi:glycerol uptake facilitator-like aquaporin
VTLADAWQHRIFWRHVPGCVSAQVGGAFVGVAAAHLMFGVELFSTSQNVRSGGAQMFSEFVATSTFRGEFLYLSIRPITGTAWANLQVQPALKHLFLN